MGEYVMKTKILVALAILGALIFVFYADLLPLRNSVAASEHTEIEAEDVKNNEVHLDEDQIQDSGIEIEEIGPGTLTLTTVVPGRIVPNPEKYAHLVSKASGVVKEVYKNIGDRVEAGEVLASLESREMAEAKAQYLATGRRAELAYSLYEQEKTLHEKQISPTQDLLKAQVDAEEKQIDWEMAKQQLYSFGFTHRDLESILTQNSEDFRLFEVRAPFSGTVVERSFALGEVVEAGKELFVVADLDDVWVELGLYPQDAQSIHEGSTILIEGPYGLLKEALLARLSPVIDSSSARVKALAILDNRDGSWRPGTYVKGTFLKSQDDVAVLVPQEAVMKIDNTECLFVKSAHGFEKRCIKVGRKDGQFVEILAGVEQGERFATKNAFLLKFEMTKSEPD